MNTIFPQAMAWMFTLLFVIIFMHAGAFGPKAQRLAVKVAVPLVIGVPSSMLLFIVFVS